MDYNDFVMKSMQAGAHMDTQGNIQHTPATVFNMFEQQKLEKPPTIPVYGAPSSFWDIFTKR